MSNGNRWTSSKGYVATDEGATRAVDRNQLIQSASATTNQDHTVVLTQDEHNQQDKTRALDFNDFQQATQALDLNEDKTRALPRDAFNFDKLPPQNPSGPSQPFPPPSPSTHQPTIPSKPVSTHPGTYSTEWSNAVNHGSQSYPSPQPSHQPVSSLQPYGTSNQPSSLHNVPTPTPHPQSPSPHPRGAEQNVVPSVSSVESMPNIIPNPQPSFSSTSPQQRDPHPLQQKPGSAFVDPSPSTYENDSPLNSSIASLESESETHRHTHGQSIKDDYSIDELTQAHLNSRVLQEVISAHRYNVTEDQYAERSPPHWQRSRQKRAQTIIFSTVGFGISLIIVALLYTHFSGPQNIQAYIQRLHLSLPQLTAQYAIAWSEKTKTLNQPSSSDVLQIIFNQNSLLLDQLKSRYSSQIDFSEAELISQPHPLRLSGAFINRLSSHIAPTWSVDGVKEALLVTNQSEQSGVILDLLTTLSVVSQRKGKQLKKFNLIVEQRSQATQSKAKDQPTTLVKLPFQLLTDQKQLNTQSFLRISWSRDQRQVNLTAPKHHKQRYFRIQRRTSTEDETDVRKDFLDVIESTGGLKGVLISPPRYISIAELSLWLSVSAPYPIYLIPPEASSI